MTWMLAFDASTPRCVIALGRKTPAGWSLLEVDETDEHANQASARLVPRIEAVLQRAGATPEDLRAVACGRGPGTFTGTRVALATAQGIALAVGAPIVAVSTLHALALSADTTDPVLALLDARRHEVYAGLVQCRDDEHVPTVQALTEEVVAPAADVVQHTRHALGDSPVTLVGPGIAPYAEVFPENWPRIVCPGPSASGLWRAAVAEHEAGGARDPASVTAVYRRKSYAELGINRPKRPFVKSPFV